MPRKKKPAYQNEYFESLSFNQKIQTAQVLSKRANARIRALEKEGLIPPSLSNAKDWLLGKGQEFFYQGKKYKDEAQVNAQLEILDVFLSSKSASVPKARQYSDKIASKIEKRIPQAGNVDKQSLYNFLSSKQFEQLKKYADSDQLIEDFIEASDENIPLEELYSAYEDFLRGEIYADEVLERARDRTMLH